MGWVGKPTAGANLCPSLPIGKRGVWPKARPWAWHCTLRGCRPPPPQGPSLGVPLAGKGAIIRTPHNIDRCSVYRPNHHVLLGLFLQREGGEGGNWQLTTTLTFKYVAMELCSYVLVLNHSQRGGNGKIGDLKHIFKWSVEG